MKKQGIIIYLLLAICLTLQAKERIIEHPPFLGWNGSTIEIDKIVLNDTETVLHIKAFYRPKNWIKMDTKTYLIADSGEKFQITGTNGIPLDKEFYMPESGEAEFTLTFPPLPPSVKSIDFVEEVERGWHIWGIQLKDKNLPKLELPAEAVVHHINLQTTLPKLEYKKGYATLKGQFLDYRHETGKEISMNVGYPMGASNPIKITINPDGSFSEKVMVVSPTPCVLYINQVIYCFLAPDEETQLFINTREKARQQSKLRKNEKPSGLSVYYNGFMAAISQEYAQQKEILDKDNKDIYKELDGKDLKGIRDYFMEKNQRQKQLIETLNISTACKDILLGQEDAVTAMNLLSGKSIYTQNMLSSGQIKREEANDFYTNLKLPEDYYTGIEKLAGLNTPQALYNFTFSRLTYNPDFAQKLGKATGITEGTLFELVKVVPIIRKIEDFTPLSDEDRTALASLSSPAFLEFAEEKNVTLLKTIEANKKKTGFNVNEAGEVTNEDLFASIISKFRGKTILVDFWATWCGPCIMANKQMAPMKEDLKDEDIIYLYLAGENSPEKTWENMIPNIKGEHFRLTQSQWDYLGKTFKVSGIPTYLVVDTEGNVTYKQTGFPGVPKMKEELLKAAGK